MKHLAKAKNTCNLYYTDQEKAALREKSHQRKTNWDRRNYDRAKRKRKHEESYDPAKRKQKHDESYDPAKEKEHYSPEKRKQKHQELIQKRRDESTAQKRLKNFR